MANYEMSQEQLNELYEAGKPTPMIMLQTGMPRSPQARVNDVWEKMGDEMGFDGQTAGPIPGNTNPLRFSAKEKSDGNDTTE